MYSIPESRFALVETAVPDAETMESYKTSTVWKAVLAEIESQLCTLLKRAEVWNGAVQDKPSKRDIAHLHLLIVQVEGLGLADRNEHLARLLVYRMKLSVEKFCNEDVQVYQDRAAMVQSLVAERLFWCVRITGYWVGALNLFSAS